VVLTSLGRPGDEACKFLKKYCLRAHADKIKLSFSFQKMVALMMAHWAKEVVELEWGPGRGAARPAPLGLRR